jgi:hypothetical protein
MSRDRHSVRNHNELKAMNLRARAGITVTMLAGSLALASVACVSPDVFLRDAGDQPGGEGGGPGTGGGIGSGSGGSSGSAGSNGAGGKTTTGTGGHVTTGAGGSVVTGAGGSVVTGSGGRPGTAGASGGVLFMDGFETGTVGDRYFWDAPNMTNLNPSSTPCGDWAVVLDGTTTNHMFSQRATCSGPSWAAGGDSGWADMRIQAKVKFPAGSTTSTRIMLGVRFASDRDQLYIEYTNDGKLKIRQKVAAGGAPSDVSNTTKVAVTNDTWVTVGLSVSGSTINAYLGADPSAPPVITAVAASTAMPKGGIAFGTTGGPASFDDILVTTP